MKLYLFIFIVISLLLVFAVPTYLTYRKTGINPITFGKEDNAHNYIGRIFKILMALLFAVFAVNLFSPDIYRKFLVRPTAAQVKAEPAERHSKLTAQCCRSSFVSFPGCALSGSPLCPVPKHSACLAVGFGVDEICCCPV